MPLPKPQLSAPPPDLRPGAMARCSDHGEVTHPDLDVESHRMVALRTGGDFWMVREGFCDTLLGGTAPDWFVPASSPVAELVKRGRGRSTWRAATNGATLYAKLHDDEGLTATLWRRWGGDRARREFEATLAAERRGVAVIRAVAFGRRRGASVFVSEEAAGAEPLAAVWAREVSAAALPQRRGAADPLIDAVAALFAAAHERGFAHRDNHPGNILAARRPDGAWHVCFADVHGSRLGGRPLSMDDSLLSLAQLDQFFHRVATRSERLRFWRAYGTGRGAADRRSTGDLRETLAALAKARQGHAKRLAAQRDRRLRRNNAYFTRLDLGAGWRATVVLRLERRHLFAEQGTPDRSEEQWRAMLSSAEAQEPAGGAGASEVVFEEHVADGWIQRVIWRWCGSPCRRAFEACHRARHRDQPAELVLGYAEHRRGWWVDRAMVIRPCGTKPRA